MDLQFDFDEIENDLKRTSRLKIDLSKYTLVDENDARQVWCNGWIHVEVWPDSNTLASCDCEVRV